MLHNYVAQLAYLFVIQNHIQYEVKMSMALKRTPYGSPLQATHRKLMKS